MRTDFRKPIQRYAGYPASLITLQLETTAHLMCASFFSNAVRNHDITIPRLTIFECADAKLNTDFAERGLYCPQTCSAVKLKSMYQETANYQSKASRK